MKPEFSRQICEKKLKYSVESEMFHAGGRTDGRTDMKVIVAFRT
jgi:hypothetical protein